MYDDTVSRSPSSSRVESPVYDRSTGELLDPLFSYDRAAEALPPPDSLIPDGIFNPLFFYYIYFHVSIHVYLVLVSFQSTLLLLRGGRRMPNSLLLSLPSWPRLQLSREL